MIKKIYTILSIDPGINSLGYAISNFNIETKKQIVTDYGTFYPSTIKDKNLRKDTRRYNDKIISCSHIKTILYHLCSTYNPDYVTSENAFFNPTRPNAYACLLLSIFSMESILYEIYKDQRIPLLESASRLYKIAPTIIKATISKAKGGKAIKADMTESIVTHIALGDISFLAYPNGDIDLLSFTEHSIDAISVGYTFGNIWLPNIINKNMTPYTLALRTKDIKANKKKK